MTEGQRIIIHSGVAKVKMDLMEMETLLENAENALNIRLQLNEKFQSKEQRRNIEKRISLLRYDIRRAQEAIEEGERMLEADNVPLHIKYPDAFTRGGKQ